MKRLIIISLIAAIIPVMGYCADNDRLFSDIASRYDVSSVYIGKAALRLAGNNMLTGKIGGKNKSKLERVGNAAKNLEAVEIINCDKKSDIPTLQKTVSDLVKQLKLEVLVDAREPGESAVVYGVVPADGTSVIDSLLIESNDGDSYSLVFIRGRIDLSELYHD